MRDTTGLPTFLADGSIIQEQDDHLVVAVRIPKATINANFHLLAALVDSAGSPKPLSVEAPPLAPQPPSRRKPHYFYAAMLFCAVLLPAPFDILLHGIAGPVKPEAPVVYGEWHVAKPSFAVGESIEIDLMYQRNRMCRTSFDRTISRASDNAVIWSTRVFGGNGGPTDASFREFRLVLNLADPLPPGDYVYSGLTHSDCATGGVYDAAHPHLTFHVDDPART